MQKFLFLACVFILLIQSGYSQQKPRLFKDINTETRPLPLSHFQTVGDSLVYFVTKEPVLGIPQDRDTISIYASNGTTTFLATQFNDGTIEHLGGTDTHFFFRHNNDIYSLKGTNKTFIADALLVDGQTFAHRKKFIFKKWDTGWTDVALWASDGSVAGTERLSINVANKSLNFVGTANEYVYFTLFDNPNNRLELWKLNTNNNQTAFIDFLPNESIYLFNNHGVATDYLFFRNFSHFYAANNTSNTLIKVPTKKMGFDDGAVINNRLYVSLRDSSANNLGVHLFNTTSNSFEAVNALAPAISIAHYYNKHIYVWGNINGEYFTQLYRTDSLFQNYTKVPTREIAQGESVDRTFFYKDGFYGIYHYDRQYPYIQNYVKIMKSDGVSLQLSVFFDSFAAGLHRSSLEQIRFKDFIFTKKQFFFNVGRDRLNWHSSNSFIMGQALWKSTDVSGSTAEVFKTNKNTLNAGIIGLSADKNDIFFFADTNNGFQLMRTDGSLKNLRPFVDSTFQSLNASPVDKPMYRLGKKLFFQHTSLYSGTEFLAVSDGTRQGTKFVGSDPFNAFSDLSNFKVHKNLLYFLSAYKVYATDGDTTIRVSVEPYSLEYAYDYYIFNNNIYLMVLKDGKMQVWKINETTLAKQKIYETNWSCCGFPRFVGTLNNQVLFAMNINFQQYLYTTDGTPSGTNLLFTFPFEVKQTFFFKNYYYLFTTSQIIKTDGTQAGTSVISQTSDEFTKASATQNYIFFYTMGYMYAKTLIVFDGTNFTQLPQFSDADELPNLFTSRDAAFFRYNKKTYITYGTAPTTAVFCEEPINSLATLGNYTFFNLPTWRYGSELWVFNKCEENLTLSGAYATDQIFGARKTITATQQLNNASVIYRAGNSVQLMPGFKVNNDSVFKAEIDGCVD